MPKIRTVRENGRLRVQHTSNQPSKTEESHGKNVNINSIMRKYFRTGLMAQRQGATYGDFSSALDYHESLNRIMKAVEDFKELPSEIRTKFDNDPAKLIDFMNDPKNIDEAVELGIAERPSEQPAVTGEGDSPAVEPPEPSQAEG